VNQWTLLVGMLPLAYMASRGGIHPMVLDARQAEEIFLTSAQSFLGVVILSNLRFSLKEAFVLFVLFAAQAFYPLLEPHVGLPSVYVRLGFAWLYLAVGIGMLIASGNSRNDLRALVRAFFKRE